MRPPQPSGYQNRKAAKERAMEEASNQEERVASDLPSLVIEPPPKDAVGVIAWANGVAAALLYEVMNDPVIKREQKWRYASDLIAKIGLTHSKALTEEKITKLEKKLGLAKKHKDDDGLEDDSE